MLQIGQSFSYLSSSFAQEERTSKFPLNPQSDPFSVDFLPLKCDACSGIFCADHVAYAQHHCGSAYQKVRGRS